MRRYECPCGNFKVEAGWWTPHSVVDALLGEHYLECVVAQADVIVRLASAQEEVR